MLFDKLYIVQYVGRNEDELHKYECRGVRSTPENDLILGQRLKLYKLIEDYSFSL